MLPEGDLGEFYVVDGRITFDRPADVETIADHGFALPGLVDAHCHVGLAAEGSTTLDEARAHAVADRDVGALLLRDAGVPHTYDELDDEPDLPRIVHAGRHLARTRRYIRGYGIELEPEQLPDAAEAQARRSGGHSTPWVKLVGDWIDRDLGDLAPCWPADVLAEAVRRAHEAGARVAVHVFGEEALPDLIAAGVDSIEHGTGLDEQTLGEVARRGIAVVPTLVNIANFDKFADQATKYPLYARECADCGAVLTRESRRRTTQAYRSMSAPTPAGSYRTDSSSMKCLPCTAVGLSNADVLAAGSWKAREWLGLPGLVEGAPADFVVYDDDPRTDLNVLRQSPAHRRPRECHPLISSVIYFAVLSAVTTGLPGTPRAATVSCVAAMTRTGASANIATIASSSSSVRSGAW